MTNFSFLRTVFLAQAFFASAANSIFCQDLVGASALQEKTATPSEFCFLNDDGVIGKIELTEGLNKETNLVVYCDKLPGGEMTIKNVGISRQCGPFEFSTDDVMPLPLKFRGFDYCPIYVDGDNRVWLIEMIPAMDGETMSAFRLELRKNIHGWRLYVVEAGYYQHAIRTLGFRDIALAFDFVTGTCYSDLIIVNESSAPGFPPVREEWDYDGTHGCGIIQIIDGFSFTFGRDNKKMVSLPSPDVNGFDGFCKCYDKQASIPEASISPGKVPPLLNITTGSIGFAQAGSLGAFDENAITFELKNSGGTAEGLAIRTTIQGENRGISIPRESKIDAIAPNTSTTVRLPITTTKNTLDGVVRFRVEVIEPRGFSPAPFSMEIPVTSFKEPSIKVSDSATPLTLWKSNTPIELDVLIQNVGRGDASKVVASLSIPNGVVCYSGNENEDIGKLAKGEVHKLSYDLMIPRTYAGSDVSIGIKLSESYNQYGSDWSKSFPFESTKKETVVIVQQGQQDQDTESEVVRATLGKTTNERGEVIFSQTNSSREVQAIAVIPKDGENCSGRTVSGDDLAVLGETAMLGLYTVVDRKFFEQTLEEIKLSMTGLTFENGVLEAGCIENAQGYLFVEYGCLQNQETIKAKLIHCESSEIIWNGLGQGTTASETFDEIVTRLDQE